MPKQALPLILQHGLIVQRIGVELLVYDEKHHQAFCFNATTATIWDLANGRNSVAEISRAASLSLGTPVPEPVVTLALTELQEKGLLERAPVAGAMTIAPAVSRRAVMRSLGAGSALLLPAVAVILAPRAAQAYNGCFDCSDAPVAARRQAAILLAAQKQQQERAAHQLSNQETKER